MKNLDTIIIMDIMHSILAAAEYDRMDEFDLFDLEHKIAYKLITCIEMDFDITAEYVNGEVVASFEAYDDNDMVVALSTRLDADDAADEDDIYELLDAEADAFVFEVTRMIDLLENDCEIDGNDSVPTQEALDAEKFDRAMKSI